MRVLRKSTTLEDLKDILRRSSKCDQKAPVENRHAIPVDICHRRWDRMSHQPPKRPARRAFDPTTPSNPPVQQPGNPCLKQNQWRNQDDASDRKNKRTGSPCVKTQRRLNTEAAKENDPEWRNLHGPLQSST